MQFSIVDDSLFVVAPIVCGGSEVGPCFGRSNCVLLVLKSS